MRMILTNWFTLTPLHILVAAPSAFGQAPSAFGQPAASTGFGSPSPAPAFGMKPAQGLFGSGKCDRLPLSVSVLARLSTDICYLHMNCTAPAPAAPTTSIFGAPSPATSTPFGAPGKF